MPKDEFDFEDPFELHGVGLSVDEDTTEEMAECFIEEFMRMRYGPAQILALFCDPHYVGPHLVWQKKGEAFVRERIAEVLARWARPVTGPQAATTEKNASRSSTPVMCEIETSQDLDATQTDPLGAPIPKLNL